MRFPEESSARRPTMTVDPDPSVLSTYPSAMRSAWPGAARGTLHRPDRLQCQGAGPLVPVPTADAERWGEIHRRADGHRHAPAVPPRCALSLIHISEPT